MEYIKKFESFNKMKRLFIEAQAEDKGKIRTCELLCSRLRGIKTNNFFDTIISEALDNPQETFEKIKEHDELYCSTRLIPMIGGYGSGMLMNNLMYMAIEQNISNKSLYILGRLDNIRWEELNEELFLKCFSNNKLFILNKDENAFIEAPYSEIF